MTTFGIIAYSFLGLAFLGSCLLIIVDEDRLVSVPRPDHYWMSFAAPILIVFGLAGAIATVVTASFLER